MASVTLEHIKKIYDNKVVAVQDFNLEIKDKEFVVFVGPSGCGKSTTLRMIAGLEDISEGTLKIGDRVVNDVEPKDRDIAMVFQNYALYPHISVYENLAFSLRIRKIKQEEVHRRVVQAAHILGIESYLDRKPRALSGGQRQRVAIGRAIVREPQVFLMDEPLSNLDAKLRVQMRTEIKRLHQRLRTTSVYVTHDQIEAMAMGDRIVVMSAAEVQQVGTPAEVYHDPANLFVARFIGSPGMNLLRGHYAGGAVHLREDVIYQVPGDWVPVLDGVLGGEGDVILGFRPEAATVNSEGLPASVYATDLLGGYTMLHLEIGNHEIVHARAGRETHYPIGTPVRFALDPAMVRFFDPTTEQAIVREVTA